MADSHTCTQIHVTKPSEQESHTHACVDYMYIFIGNDVPNLTVTRTRDHNIIRGRLSIFPCEKGPKQLLIPLLVWWRAELCSVLVPTANCPSWQKCSEFINLTHISRVLSPQLLVPYIDIDFGSGEM